MKDRGFIANNTMENGGKEYKSRFLQNPRFCQSSCILTRQPATIWVNLASIIYLTLGNIISWRRNKLDAKVLLGYLPILKAKTISQKRSKGYKLAKSALYQHALDMLI